jgi:hypothetical protein
MTDIQHSSLRNCSVGFTVDRGEGTSHAEPLPATNVLGMRTSSEPSSRGSGSRRLRKRRTSAVSPHDRHTT